MTPTSEERREVAARLRELDHEITSYDTIESGVNKLKKAVHGNTSFSPIEYSVRNLCGLANTLADLIDPTCHVVSEALHTGSFGCEEAGTEFTLSCGHTVIVDGDFHPGYCDECGARVVDDD